MPFDRAPTREVYDGLDLQRIRPRRRAAAIKPLLWIALAIVLVLVFYLSLYLRSLSSGTAYSDAQDYVTLAINATVNRVLAEKGYGYGDFVALEKNSEGEITAIITDTARVNLLSSELLMEISKAADNGQLDVGIPLGDLLGAGVLQGRGPKVPVKVGMMTSSFLRFENTFTSAGINQTRHALTIVASVDIDLLIPMGSMHTTVETEIPIAETVIVGKVPNTYLHMDSSE